METAESFQGLRGVALSLVQHGQLTREQAIDAADSAARTLGATLRHNNSAPTHMKDNGVKRLGT